MLFHVREEEHAIHPCQNATNFLQLGALVLNTRDRVNGVMIALIEFNSSPNILLVSKCTEIEVAVSNVITVVVVDR